MDPIFRALADPTRRWLLDRLQIQDGQTLTELCEGAEMTRYGVMKHLRLLEEAGLVATRKVGREKFHYLNPVPIQEIHDRWISKYGAPLTRGLLQLKHDMEESAMTDDRKPAHVYEVYIRTTAEQLWDAITDPAFTVKYFYDMAVDSSWEPDSPVVYRGTDGHVGIDGRVLRVESGRLLEHTFAFLGNPQDAPSRVRWEIEPRGHVCKLTLVHDDFAVETDTFRQTGPGWNPILSGLKTLLETGEPLVIDLPATAELARSPASRGA